MKTVADVYPHALEIFSDEKRRRFLAAVDPDLLASPIDTIDSAREAARWLEINRQVESQYIGTRTHIRQAFAFEDPENEKYYALLGAWAEVVDHIKENFPSS